MTRQAVAARAMQLVETQGEALLAEYRRRFGSVLSADNAAELFPDYAESLESRTLYRAAVHPASQWVRDELFRRALADPAVKEVVFTAGGNGAGKTTSGLQGDVVLDSTFSNPPHSAKLVGETLEAGKEVHIVYTYRPVEEAFRGILERSLTQGRTVPIEMAIHSHQGAAQTIRELYAMYATHPNVRFQFVDNRAPEPRLGSVALTRKQNYVGIVERLHAILETYRPRLPENIYRATKGGRQ